MILVTRLIIFSISIGLTSFLQLYYIAIWLYCQCFYFNFTQKNCPLSLGLILA
nr:MAG TPA: hypothetical protein [Caudoviricetes sp.]